MGKKEKHIDVTGLILATICFIFTFSLPSLLEFPILFDECAIPFPDVSSFNKTPFCNLFPKERFFCCQLSKLALHMHKPNVNHPFKLDAQN